jgi:hypothetical protein
VGGAEAMALSSKCGALSGMQVLLANWSSDFAILTMLVKLSRK